jgi:hypothetical protein
MRFGGTSAILILHICLRYPNPRPASHNGWRHPRDAEAADVIQEMERQASESWGLPGLAIVASDLMIVNANQTSSSRAVHL